MSVQNDGIKAWLKKLKIVVLTFIFGIVIGAVIFNIIENRFNAKDDTINNITITKIGFEDIGELITQVAYCTEINDTNDAGRELFGILMPGTKSRQIYSYNVKVSAGIDFGKVDYDPPIGEEKTEFLIFN